MSNYLYLPGASGNYASVADVNLLDADTAHLHQSVGDWVSGAGTSSVAQSTDVTPLFGNYTLKLTLNGASALATSFTSPSLTAGDHAIGAYVYTDESDLEAFWRFDGTFGTQYDLTPGGWTWVETTKSVTGAVACQLYVRKQDTSNADSGELVYVDKVVLQTGTSATFVPSLRIVGDLEIEAYIRADNNTTATIVSRYLTAAGSRTFRFHLEADKLQTFISLDGSAAEIDSSTAHGVSFPWADPHTVKMTRSATTGTISYYLDGVAKGTAASTAGGLWLGDQDLMIGNYSGGSGTSITADILTVSLRDGIDGPLVVDVDFTDLTKDEVEAASFTDDTGYHTVTLNGDAWAYVEPYAGGGVLGRAELLLDASNQYVAGSPLWPDLSGNNHHAQYGSAAGADTNDPDHLPFDGEQYLWLPGASGNYASTPSTAALNLASTAFTLTIDAALATTRAAGEQPLLTKDTVTGERSWNFAMDTSGKLRMEVYNASNNLTGTIVSTAAVADADYVRAQYRVTFDGTNKYNFSVKPYGGAWAALGSEVTESDSPTHADGTAIFEIGKRFTSLWLAGRVYSAQVHTDDSQSTCIFDADFTDTLALTEPYATFTEKSSNAATVTINRAASGAVSTVVDRAWMSFTTDDYFVVPDHDMLDFALADPLTFLVVASGNAVGAGEGQQKYAGKGGTGARYLFSSNNNLGKSTIYFDDGAAPLALAEGAAVAINQTPYVFAVVRDRVADTVTLYRDGVNVGSATDSLTGSMANASDLLIGAYGTPTEFFEGLMSHVVIWREALTPAELEEAGRTLLGWVPKLMLLGVG